MNRHPSFKLDDREPGNSKREGGLEERPLIAVVGPCAAGKSTVVSALREQGYNAREIKQEHSYVETMWQRFTRPDLLIYLAVSQEVAGQRRAAEADAAWWDRLEQRLQHARRHADLHIDTDRLGPEEVVEKAMSFLERYTS